MLTEVVAEGEDNLQAIVKRYGFIVMRIAMILTRLRQYEQQNSSDQLYCDDTDFEVALSVVGCCYEHTRLLLTSMSGGHKHALKDPDRKRRFWNALPAKFKTEEAVLLAAGYGISERTVMRLLKDYMDLKVRKIDRGLYEKLSQ